MSNLALPELPMADGALTVTDAAVADFDPLLAGVVNNRRITSVTVRFTTASGRGFYRFFQDPTAAGLGAEIPAGGGELRIVGRTNIEAFKIIAATGDTLQLFAIFFAAGVGPA